MKKFMVSDFATAKASNFGELYLVHLGDLRGSGIRDSGRNRNPPGPQQQRKKKRQKKNQRGG